MDTVQDKSIIKEEIRQKYYSIAQKEELSIRNQLESDCATVQNDANYTISRMFYRNHPSGYACSLLIIVMGIFMFAKIKSGVGLVLGIAAGLTLFFIWDYIIKQMNIKIDADKRRIRNEADDKMKQLRKEADISIKQAYSYAMKRANQDVDWYNKQVEYNYNKIIQNKESLNVMVEHVIDMFQRMVSHADVSSNKKFVEVDFIYKVEIYGICYKYKSTYSNPKDNFNFDMQRYRNLNTVEECEGLAKAIAEAAVDKIKKTYPQNSFNISLSHVDAEVTLKFRAANKNYIPPKTIY